jgi:hypothetical protein
MAPRRMCLQVGTEVGKRSVQRSAKLVEVGKSRYRSRQKASTQVGKSRHRGRQKSVQRSAQVGTEVGTSRYRGLQSRAAGSKFRDSGGVQWATNTHLVHAQSTLATWSPYPHPPPFLYWVRHQTGKATVITASDGEFWQCWEEIPSRPSSNSLTASQ